MKLSELRTEFEQQAHDAPDPGSTAAAAERSFSSRNRRRRGVSLLAAATAVVVLVGGVALGINHFRGGGSAPAGPPPAVGVPQVLLPDGTRLIRHQLPTITSPVSAAVPQGMTGAQWIDGGGRLSVGYFAGDPSSTGNGDGPASSSVGYVITASEDDPISVDGRATNVTTTPTVAGGHPAALVSAAPGAVDAFGFPAERRISWQLGDGRWIHVWAGSSDDPTLLDGFARGVSERPTALVRTIHLGVSLPGLTEEWSVNSTMVDGTTQTSVYLCPPGVNLFAGPAEVTDSGSGSAAPDASTTVSAPTSAPPASSGSPISRCLGAMIAVMPLDQVTAQGGFAELSVDGNTVLVDNQQHTAVKDLGDGLVAIVGSPTGTPLSPEDLAAAVLSVRASSSVVAVPASKPDPGMVVTERATASSVAPTASGASSSAAVTAAPTG